MHLVRCLFVEVALILLDKYKEEIMKTCPICSARCFDDMNTCYGCMHRFCSTEATAKTGVRAPEMNGVFSADEALVSSNDEQRCTEGAPSQKASQVLGRGVDTAVSSLGYESDVMTDPQIPNVAPAINVSVLPHAPNPRVEAVQAVQTNPVSSPGCTVGLPLTHGSIAAPIEESNTVCVAPANDFEQKTTAASPAFALEGSNGRAAFQLVVSLRPCCKECSTQA